MKKIAYHISLSGALNMGPPADGELAIPIFAHGTMQTELYAPENIDRQNPHNRDEIYVVANGEGKFFDGEKRVQVKEGSFIFVPAGVEHRFENFSNNFAVWVIFYGPEGGETDA